MPAYSKSGKFGVKGEQSYMEDRHAVENEKGSGTRSCKCCDSWLAHWANNARTSRMKCVYLGCNSKPAHGAHVKFIDMDKLRRLPKSWLIPLCEKHNNPGHKNPFYIDARVELVEEKSTKKCFKGETIRNKNNNFEMNVLRQKPTLKCRCGSLSSHYFNNTKSTRTRCSASPCGKQTREFGVLKSADGRTDKKLWLAPLCKAHKASKTPIFIESVAWLVPLGKDKNCL